MIGSQQGSEKRLASELGTLHSMSKLKIRNGAYFSPLSMVEHSSRFSTLNEKPTLVWILYLCQWITYLTVTSN